MERLLEPRQSGKREEYGYLSVTDDGMADAGIRRGSRVLVHRQNYAENGQIVVCRLGDRETTLRRYRQRTDEVALLSENPSCETVVLRPADFKNGEAEILGVAERVIDTL